jgi:hypothetical protein
VTIATRRLACLPVLLLLALFALPACKARIGGESGVKDKLRDENAQLREQVEQLQTRLQRREQQLEVMRQQVDGEAGPVEGAQPPRVVGLTLDRYSGPVDTDGDGADDLLRLYVRPHDQDGRQLSAAGRATVQLARVTEQDATVLAEAQFPPEQWQDAYRSSFMGTHYTLELPLPADLPRALEQATVKVTLHTADSGATVSVQQPYRLDLAPDASAR